MTGVAAAPASLRCWADGTPPARWKLTSGTYYRREGPDTIIASQGSLLRLNGASARIFDFLVGSSEAGTFSTSQVESLGQRLLCEGLIGPADESDTLQRHEVGHTRCAESTVAEPSGAPQVFG